MTTLEDMPGPRAGNDIAVALGWAIKVTRTERGCSRKELAGQSDMSYSYLGHVETGRKVPPPETLVKIAHALGVSTSDLLARAKNSPTAGHLSGAPAAGARETVGLESAGVREQAAEEYDSELMVAELGDLVRRMPPGDRERLLDLARRLAK